MMWQIWLLAGRVAYWLGWPLLFVYIWRSNRTRVLVRCGNEVLVVKGWLGDGTWQLPGGGMHRQEVAAVGASRELREETGIDVNATELQLIFRDEPVHQHGLRYHITAYAVELAEKPTLHRQLFEITDAKWLHWQDVYYGRSVAADVRKILAAFYKL